jgi:XTP/dITP diphosphohydrolase
MSRRRLEAGRLVVASHNPGKVRELDELLAPFGIETVGAPELGLAEPAETADTFDGNARLKALAAARATGLPAVADDSGLAVEALDGAPGIHSARWAGAEKDYARAMGKLEEALRVRQAVTADQRRARFVAVLALAWPDGHVESVRGEVAGTLVWPPRGDRGLGYDPMFQPVGHERTFGEMTPEEKHGLRPEEPDSPALSHRARAMLALKEACLGG